MAERQNNKTLHTVKAVGLVTLIFVLVNFLFETIITVIESQVAVSLYGIFPFTRIILLVLTIVIYRRYAQRKRTALEHKA